MKPPFLQDERLLQVVAAQPYPLLFVTISGAHLYGFPSPDSDFDLRGVHLLPVAELLGLDTRDRTLESSQVVSGLEVDLVTHDAYKFFSMLLKKNGYVLEQVFSPLVVRAAPGFIPLREIAARCVTRHHASHYKGFAHNQWQLFDKERPRRLKPLLYVYRVLLTGIHLLRTGEVEANLVTLNDGEFHLPRVRDLVARKLAQPEQTAIEDEDVATHQGEFERLLAELEQAALTSALPEIPTPAARADLNALLLELRGITQPEILTG